MEEVIVKKYFVSLLLLPFSVSVVAASYDAEIKARQNAYSEIKDNVEAVGKMLKSGDLDFAKLERHGEVLTKHSSGLKDLFPEGSQAGSDAKKAIWKNYDKFSAGLDKLDQGFQDFYAAAKVQDKAALVAGFKDATGTCKACHRRFRK